MASLNSLDRSGSIPPGLEGMSRRSGPVLVAVLIATFLINVDTTIVNVALPALSQQLGSSTSELQWVVDAYNLAFAALILTGGTIGDRFGRRRTLVSGLVVFAISSAGAAVAGSTDALIAWRVLMGAAAAFIFPTTLSIISQTFPNRAERARAIGAWGGTAGAAVAFGPIVGGFLLEHYSWGSIFWLMVPLAAAAAGFAVVVVPRDSTVRGERLDVRGLVLAAFGLTALIYTIIEAPTEGWWSVRTMGGFVVAVVMLAALVLVEVRQDEPMLDVRLFANMRFTAASGAVTAAWFALAGFVFLIILYFQIMRGYSALEAGVRTLPVAISVGIFSGVGTTLAVRIGNKIVIALGLVLVASAFTWVAAFQTATTSYWAIVAQMLLLGSGIGMSTAPATEAILGVVPPAKAGVGSAVNDATRLFGATLGVAVLGSIYSSLYQNRLSELTGVPAAIVDAAKSSFAASRQIAATLPAQQAKLLLAFADAGFLDGLHLACAIAAGACVLGALIVIAFLPAHPDPESAARVDDSGELDVVSAA